MYLKQKLILLTRLMLNVYKPSLFKYEPFKQISIDKKLQSRQMIDDSQKAARNKLMIHWQTQKPTDI